MIGEGSPDIDIPAQEGSQPTTETSLSESLSSFLDRTSGKVGRLLTEPDEAERDAERVKAIEAKLAEMAMDPRLANVVKAARKHLDETDFKIPLVEADGKVVMSLVLPFNDSRAGVIEIKGSSDSSGRGRIFELYEIDEAYSKVAGRRTYNRVNLGSPDKIIVDKVNPEEIRGSHNVGHYVERTVFYNDDPKSQEGYLAYQLAKCFSGSINGSLKGSTADSIEETSLKYIKGIMDRLDGKSLNSTTFPPPPAAVPPVGGPTGPSGGQ